VAGVTGFQQDRSLAAESTPQSSLAWLALRLKDFGKKLRQGHIVLTGSPLPLYAVSPGDRVAVACGRLPMVTMLVSPDNPKKT